MTRDRTEAMGRSGDCGRATELLVRVPAALALDWVTPRLKADKSGSAGTVCKCIADIIVLIM